MYELVNAKGNTFYIDNPAKIGLVLTGESEAVLIDSGNDSDAGKKVKRILDSNGWTLKAVYCTHSHADHIGGCSCLQERTGCRVYAAGSEACFTKYTLLEPAMLYGGDPPGELRNKFLVAKTCDVTPLTDEALPEGWEMISLPGHTGGQVGFITGDGVMFPGDSILGRDVLTKHPVSYIFDVGECLRTLDKLAGIKAELFVMSHGEALGDITELAAFNKEVILSVGGRIEALCENPVTFEALLKGVFEEYGISMNMMQHELVGSTVRSYLTWLLEEKRIKYSISDNMLFWEKES